MARSSCPLDCPDACTLDITLDAEGRAAQVRGDSRNPLTAGRICGKVARLPEHLYGKERITTPMLRRGPKGQGDFSPISWDEALELAVQKLETSRREHGPTSLLPCSYGGSNGVLTEGTFDRRFFARWGATRLQRTLCAAPSAAARSAMVGRLPGVALADFVHAKLVVLWGNNPHATGVHLADRLREARRRGARVLVVDPRVIPACREADQHLALRPGSDLPLALGLIRWFFATGRADIAQLERWTTGAETLRARAEPWTLDRTAEATGLNKADIERFALTFAESSPAILRAGWGVERSRCGGSAIAALIALPLVAGKQGVRGGGFSMSLGAALPALEAVEEPPVRRVNLARLGEALTDLRDPPVQVLWVYNCNPLVTVPDQRRVRTGLSREDLFTVVHDAVLTDTARYADLVLPATVFTEHDDLAPSYGAHLMARLRPVTRPPELARPNAWVFRALEERLGLTRAGDTTTPDEEALRLLAPFPALREQLDADGIGGPYASPPVPFVDVFPTTADQRVHLVPPSLDAEAPAGLYGWQPDPAEPSFPLALITPARAETISSTFGQLAAAAPLEIHPADAQERAIADGDPVLVFNPLGQVQVAARVTARVRPGVVSLPKGLWAHHCDSPDGPNALIPAGLTDLGGGPAYFDARVQVARGPERA